MLSGNIVTKLQLNFENIFLIYPSKNKNVAVKT